MKYRLSKKFIVSTACLVFCLFANAQYLDSSIYKQFTPSVVQRVYEIKIQSGSQMGLQKQKAIAKSIKSADSLIVFYIQQGYPVNFIDSIKSIQQSKLDSLLSPLERFTYYTAPRYGTKPSPIPYSLISLAIKNRDTLSLTTTVINKLLKKLDTLSARKQAHYSSNLKKPFNEKRFETKTIENLLTDQQVVLLLSIKNRFKVIDYALDDWDELVERGLTTNYDKDSTIAALRQYYTAKQTIYDQYRFNKKKKSTLLKQLNADKPVALRVLQHARRNPSNNTQGQTYP